MHVRCLPALLTRYICEIAFNCLGMIVAIEVPVRPLQRTPKCDNDLLTDCTRCPESFLVYCAQYLIRNRVNLLILSVLSCSCVWALINTTLSRMIMNIRRAELRMIEGPGEHPTVTFDD